MPPKKRVREDAIDVDAEAGPPKPKAKQQVSLDSFVKQPKKEIAHGGLADGIADDKWREVLSDELTSPAFAAIEAFLAKEDAAGKQVFPPRRHIFSALNMTPFDSVKVVLLGQDPYHDDNQAHGLCFSVLPPVKPPPSLKNMYKELETDIPGFVPPTHGYLASWAQQGVLMINATLTVEAHKANSHSKIGWQAFTDGIIRKVSQRAAKPVVFLLWGGFAQKKVKLIDEGRHKVIQCAHPSPLSVTKWWGCKTFSKCNEALEQLGHSPIDWKLPAEPPKVL